jgi:hypothetical protein
LARWKDDRRLWFSYSDSSQNASSRSHLFTKDKPRWVSMKPAPSLHNAKTLTFTDHRRRRRRHIISHVLKMFRFGGRLGQALGVIAFTRSPVQPQISPFWPSPSTRRLEHCAALAAPPFTNCAPNVRHTELDERFPSCTSLSGPHRKCAPYHTWESCWNGHPCQ